ncbi:MAG: Mur ligase family protein [Minisyncoccia bacterium]
MNDTEKIWAKLEELDFRISTDTRKPLPRSAFFALKGESFDGNDFVEEALKNGAECVVTENKKFSSLPKVFVVESSLGTLQEMAGRYRGLFNIPVIVIGGSNGKTTTKDLVTLVLARRFKTASTEGNLNNEIGVPLSLFSLGKETEIGVFEIGANHPGEHTALLKIARPTHVIVTNSGLDHLEGFGSPEAVVKANNEISEWAEAHGAEIIAYRDYELKVLSPLPLSLSLGQKKFKTKLVGKYNLENINGALRVAELFGIESEEALEAISSYEPREFRSQVVERGKNTFVVDCYNANPSSMSLSLESFFETAPSPRGLILGDMLELGSYAEAEHEKIIKSLVGKPIDFAVFVGKHFKQVLGKTGFKGLAFADSAEARDWLSKQNFSGYTILLKGSRGMKIERVL